MRWSRTIAGALVVMAAAPGVQAKPMSETEADALREEVAALRSRLELLEKRLAEDPAPPVAASAAPPTPSPRVEWKGSPRFVDGDRAFKAKGRIQADASYVSAPKGLDDRAFGFSNEFRRIRLGGEGKLGGGFGYKLEVELSDNSIDLVDTFVTYENGAWQLTFGNQNPLQSLDELTGDTNGSVMERAAFTDAFNFERRLGLSAQYKRGVLLAQAGIFTDDISAIANDSDGPAGGDENNSYSLDGRLVLVPRVGAAQLHFGGSLHWRRLGRVAEDGMRYRQRPFIHSVNSRLIGTPEQTVTRETSYGLEFAGLRGPWHTAAEVHWFRAARPGLPDLRFAGAYAEIGYFLTRGDTRPYENGIFGSIKPKNPVGKGGMGALQVNLRYDYLDLDSRELRGGKQDAWLVALVWTPIQYLRFNLNYGILDYTGAAALANGDRDYRVQVLGSRFELDF